MGLDEQLIAIALEAGAAILPIFRSGAESRSKSDGSPVTEADAKAEAIILGHLTRQFPEIPVIAEEAVAEGRIPAIGQRFFLVDPLDGTKEFISGSGDFTVNIALIDHGVPVAGVVYAPALGRIFIGSADGAREAAVVDGAPGPWRAITVRIPPETGITVVASRSHMTDETRAFIDRFPVADLVSAGSSLKFCEVAAGRADLYPRLGRTMEWDTAAADAVLRAAGGSVRTLDGALLRYGKRNQPTDSDFANPWFVASGPLAVFPAA
jgi:3'(2'),5'-bisphosphate nucleotidase